MDQQIVFDSRVSEVVAKEIKKGNIYIPKKTYKHLVAVESVLPTQEPKMLRAKFETSSLFWM